ncbi:MAG: redox-sensing transcriptional repressor Rex [Anaerolineales bacterium]|nr:redox-sensing transcriptional repressor Rex [Anaerolineales bacterium]
MRMEKVPDIVIGRLPLYLRALTQMSAEGSSVTSSHELARRLGISSAQIRKDLSQFGEFGKQGTGYNISFLREQLEKILGVDQTWDVAVIGIGDLGRAIAHYAGFLHRGFQVCCLYDSDPEKIGEIIKGIKVQSMDLMVQGIRQMNIKVAMLAVPLSAAQQVADELVRAGVRAILNYAPTSIKVPEGVHVQQIDPVLHLQHMTYYIDKP